VPLSTLCGCSRSPNGTGCDNLRHSPDHIDSERGLGTTDLCGVDSPDWIHWIYCSSVLDIRVMTIARYPYLLSDYHRTIELVFSFCVSTIESMSYVRNRVSCLLCRKVVTQIGQHYGSNVCQYSDNPTLKKKLQYCYDHKFSMSELDTLLEEAGIEFGQIGVHRGDYHLARYGDTGPYALGNCRFITVEENLAEQKRSPESGKYKRTDAVKQRMSEVMKDRWKRGDLSLRRQKR